VPQPCDPVGLAEAVHCRPRPKETETVTAARRRPQPGKRLWGVRGREGRGEGEPGLSLNTWETLARVVRRPGRGGRWTVRSACACRRNWSYQRPQPGRSRGARKAGIPVFSGEVVFSDVLKKC